MISIFNEKGKFRRQFGTKLEKERKLVLFFAISKITLLSYLFTKEKRLFKQISAFSFFQIVSICFDILFEHNDKVFLNNIFVNIAKLICIKLEYKFLVLLFRKIVCFSSKKL